MTGEVETTALGPMDVRRVMAALPHRYPMLLIDRVVSLVPNQANHAIKPVSVNEPFFQGHFPTRPIMPGVLIVEAMAQAAGGLAVESMQLADTGKLVYFMSIDSARFRKPVVPGDQLKLFVSVQRNRGNVWKFSGEAKVGDIVVAQATYSAMIMDS